jgi:enamine deaminase RidA (YjgF/YER057c/UK114 family)
MESKTKIKVPARTKWEDLLGYSRAVRTGNIIKVSGTAAIDNESNIIGVNNAYEQTKYIIEKIGSALKEAGGSLDDIIRNTVYVTNISNFSEIARAHGEFFGSIKPALTFIEISRFIDPDILVEIESEAVIS